MNTKQRDRLNKCAPYDEWNSQKNSHAPGIKSSMNCRALFARVLVCWMRSGFGMGKMWSRQQFVQVFGGVYEHSPWVAEAVYDAGVPATPLDTGALIERLATVVDEAGEARQLALLRLHPELVGKTAIAGKLTESSKAEQQGARLDQCSPDEFARFQDLNARYQSRFGFPFIIAVRGLTRELILRAFELRIANDRSVEFRRPRPGCASWPWPAHRE